MPHQVPNIPVPKNRTWRKRLRRFFALPPEPQAQTTNLNGALQYFGNIIKRRCIAFILSDFMSHNYEKSLDLIARKHDVIGIRVYDPHEATLPEVGLLHVKDAETQQTFWIDTNDDLAAQSYRNAFKQHTERCKNAFARCGADLLSVPTNKPYIPPLTALFRQRK